MAHYFFAVVTNASITYYGTGVHCAIWINVEYSHGIEAGIKRIHFGVSTGILACSFVLIVRDITRCFALYG